MCGDCQESADLGKLAALTWGHSLTEKEEWYHSFIFKLLESDRPLTILQESETFLAERVSLARAEETDNRKHPPLAIYTVLCCLVKVLLEKGFDSLEYQSLIRPPHVVEAITTYCDLLIRDFDFPLFQNSSFLAAFLDKEFFLSREISLKKLSDPRLAQESLTFLNGYVDWWHVECGDWVGYFHRVHAFFPYIVLGFAVTRRHYPTHPVFERMLQNYRPSHFTTRVGLEMWLQRQAALQVYDVQGISAFLPFGGTTIRPILLCYLLIKGKLDAEVRQQLHDSIIASGCYDPERANDEWVHKPVNIYWYPEYFLIRYL